MYVYLNINSFDINKLKIFNKIKNKNFSGFFYKITYESEYFSVNNIIFKVYKKDIEKLIKLENYLLDIININKKKTNNIENLLNKNIQENEYVYIKISGFFSNNYNYGLVYKLIY